MIKSKVQSTGKLIVLEARTHVINGQIRRVITVTTPISLLRKCLIYRDEATAMGAGRSRIYKLSAPDTNIIFFSLEKYLNRNFYYYVLSYDTQLKSIRDTLITK